MINQEQLLARFVTTFARFDDMYANESLSPIDWQLAAGSNDNDIQQWRPLKISTEPSILDELYTKLPGRFPPLYERLVLSCRWAEVDLGTYRLLANPPGPDLSGLFQKISNDQGLWDALVPAGYIQFGKGPDMDYDPVCFDKKSQDKSGECRIVKIDHEQILCNYRVKVVAELSPSFEHLLLQTIKEGEQR